MWYSWLAYLKFLLRSKNQHAVHSPFVFDLLTKCLYDQKNYEAYTEIMEYKQALLHNKTSIIITDLGSGSKITPSHSRTVAHIARYSGTAIKRAKLLYRLSKYLECNSALELGTSLGIATHALSLGRPDSKIKTIEGCPNISKFTQANFAQFGLLNIELLRGDFKEVIPQLNSKTYDLIYIDGNHNKEATLGYFEMLLPRAHNDTVFIIDDIYWSKGMTEAWNLLKEHPKVTVSIDTFYWGFLFLRREQLKQHFVIRV